MTSHSTPATRSLVHDLITAFAKIDADQWSMLSDLSDALIHGDQPGMPREVSFDDCQITITLGSGMDCYDFEHAAFTLGLNWTGADDFEIVEMTGDERAMTDWLQKTLLTIRLHEAA